MAKKSVRHAKISGNHTTLIEAAVPLVREIVKHTQVRRVTPGFIRGGLRNLKRFPATVKIKQESGYIALVVRAQTAVQEIHIYTEEAAYIAQRITAVGHTHGYQVRQGSEKIS